MPPDRGRGDRHRPPGHAVRRPAVDPRRDPVPAPAAGARLGDGRGRAGDEARAARSSCSSACATCGRARPAGEPLALRVDRRGRRLPRRGALIVVLAVMTGFQDGIRDKIISANPHLLVLEAGGRGVRGRRRAPLAGARACPACGPRRRSCCSRRCSPPGRRRHRRPPARRGPRDAGACGTLQQRVQLGSLDRLLEGRSRRSCSAWSWRGCSGRSPGDTRDGDLAAGRDDRGRACAQDAALHGGRHVEVGHVRVRLLARLHVARRRAGVRRPRRPGDRDRGEARPIACQARGVVPRARRRRSGCRTGCATGWT